MKAKGKCLSIDFVADHSIEASGRTPFSCQKHELRGSSFRSAEWRVGVGDGEKSAREWQAFHLATGGVGLASVGGKFQVCTRSR